MPIDAISSHYIALAFAIERHMEGFVDAYIGPPELKEQALAQPLPPLQAIAADVAALRGELRASDYPLRRKGYISAQLDGMSTMVRILSGEQLPYREEVR